jgi:hypothetical protein
MPTVLLSSLDTRTRPVDHRKLDETACKRRLAASALTECRVSPTNGLFAWTSAFAIVSCVVVGLAVIFTLGVVNFALHSAVLDSGHPLVRQMPGFVRLLGGRLTLLAEFLVLLAAMLLAANGWAGLVWAYGGYSALNALSAWLILSGRM